MTPGSASLSTNASFTAFALAVEDAQSGYVGLNSFIGGTIVRVILDLDIIPDMTESTSTNVGTWILHHGVFVDDATSWSSTFWEPNIPHANFMARGGHSGWYRKSSTTDGGSAVLMADSWGTEHGNGRRAHYDIPVKRKIRENDNLAMAFSYFETGIVNQVDVGYTGRVLVMLP